MRRKQSKIRRLTGFIVFFLFVTGWCYGVVSENTRGAEAHYGYDDLGRLTTVVDEAGGVDHADRDMLEVDRAGRITHHGGTSAGLPHDAAAPATVTGSLIPWPIALGVMLVIVGAPRMVKACGLLALPLVFVTTTVPVVAPLGTVVVIA